MKRISELEEEKSKNENPGVDHDCDGNEKHSFVNRSGSYCTYETDCIDLDLDEIDKLICDYVQATKSRPPSEIDSEPIFR